MTTPAFTHRVRNTAISVLVLALAIVPFVGSTAHAADGDVYTTHADKGVGVGIKAFGVGGGGTQYISAATFLTPAGTPEWAFCVQPLVSGGTDTGTETDVSTLADSNSENVKANAHRIQAVLDASVLPSPTEVKRFRPDGSGGWVLLDYYENVVADEPWEWVVIDHGKFVFPVSADIRLEVAAVQSAIWHYSDGWNPTGPGNWAKQAGVGNWGGAQTVTMDQIYARYLELVAAGDAALEPTVSLDATASRIGDSVVFDLTASGLANASVSGNHDLHTYDADTGACDTSSTVDSVDVSSGDAQLCSVVTTDGTYSLTAQGTATVPSLAYLDRGNTQDLVIHGGNDELSDDASADVSVTTPPEIEVDPEVETAPPTIPDPPATSTPPATTEVAGSTVSATSSSTAPATLPATGTSLWLALAAAGMIGLGVFLTAVSRGAVAES